MLSQAVQGQNLSASYSRLSAPWKVSNIQFDPDGDVILIIHSEAQERTARFQVSSHRLCLASSVFRAMLDANAYFKEENTLRYRATSSPPIEVTLEDDDPKVLALLLRIVHLQSDWVPGTLDDDQLYQVAIVCDKYDMRQVLGLWLDQWIPVGTTGGGKIAGDRWLFISYVFGREDLFMQLSKQLILTSTVDTGGSLLSPSDMSVITNDKCSFSPYIPSSILAEISTRRQQAMKDILDYIHQKIEAYRVSGVLHCTHRTKTDLCDTFFLGFLLKTFEKLKLYPLKTSEPENIQASISIQDFKSQVLDGLKSPNGVIFQVNGSRICGCRLAYSNNSSNCRSCGQLKANHATTCSPIPGLKHDIDEILAQIQGLEWSKFVRNTQVDKVMAVSKNHDLGGQLDPDGDVILVIKTEAQERMARFQVNSHSLRLASSVFQVMLGANAHFKEGNALRNRDTSSPPIDITLGDDEPKALELLLRIIHFQFDGLPKTLDDDQLYQVAIVCDKYDMRQVLGLWLDQWIPVGTPGGGKIVGDRWLFIAYVFGREALFKQLSKDLILTSTVDAGGSLLSISDIANDRCSFNHYIPSSISAEISARRQQAIKGMLDYIRQKIEAYRTPEAPLCAHQAKTDICDSLFLGFLQKMFAKLKTYPLKPSQLQTSISIEELKRQVDGLESLDTIIFQTSSLRICSCSPAYYNCYNNCGSCGYPEPNHATTCSPIPELKNRIQAMYTQIEGLEWSQFAHDTKSDGATITNMAPKGKDLWDYLEYN